MVMKKRVMRGIGDGNRPAVADLLLEDRHDAAGRAQDVAEADHGEPRGRLLRERVDVALGDLLGGPHDAGGTNRLVGGDHDEAQHAVTVGQVGHALGAQHVVSDRLADVRFHQRHVLVGGGVEDDFGAMLLEDLLHPLRDW